MKPLLTIPLLLLCLNGFGQEKKLVKSNWYLSSELNPDSIFFDDTLVLTKKSKTYKKDEPFHFDYWERNYISFDFNYDCKWVSQKNGSNYQKCNKGIWGIVEIKAKKMVFKTYSSDNCKLDGYCDRCEIIDVIEYEIIKFNRKFLKLSLINRYKPS